MFWNKRSSIAAIQLVEFEQLFPSLRLAKSSRWARRMAKWLGLLLLAIVCFTAFAPWQQFVGGNPLPGNYHYPIQLILRGIALRADINDN